MKSLIMLIISFAIVQSAFASDVLNCWKTDFHPRKPFLTATIDSDSVLSNIQFNYRNSGYDNVTGPVNGELITTARSPYKGNMEYSLDEHIRLILPADLSNDNLVDVETTGIGYGKDENGVLINDANGSDDGGSHTSYRLSCRSTK